MVFKLLSSINLKNISIFRYIIEILQKLQGRDLPPLLKRRPKWPRTITDPSMVPYVAEDLAFLISAGKGRKRQYMSFLWHGLRCQRNAATSCNQHESTMAEITLCSAIILLDAANEYVVTYQLNNLWLFKSKLYWYGARYTGRLNETSGDLYKSINNWDLRGISGWRYTRWLRAHCIKFITLRVSAKSNTIWCLFFYYFGSAEGHEYPDL